MQLLRALSKTGDSLSKRSFLGSQRRQVLIAKMGVNSISPLPARKYKKFNERTTPRYASLNIGSFTRVELTLPKKIINRKIEVNE